MLNLEIKKPKISYTNHYYCFSQNIHSVLFDLHLMLYLGVDDGRSYIWEMSAGAMALVEPIIEVGQIERGVACPVG